MIPEIEKPLPDENEAARIKKIALIRVVDDGCRDAEVI